MTFHPAFPRPEERLSGGSDPFVFSLGSGPGRDGLTGVFDLSTANGGSGTAGGHWEDDTLTNALMTGHINDDGAPHSTGDNMLSEYSVTTLADLGHGVSYDAWTDTAYTDPLIA